MHKAANGRIFYRIIMKTMLQERVTIHCNIILWYTGLFLNLKPWRFQQQKQQWIKNERNWNRFRRGTWRKSEVIKRWSMKQGRRAQKFILPYWWTSVIWKNAELEAEHQKYKGRVILWGDFVKDDSGFYAVFTEQGPSASQMPAAEVMDIITRLPGCAWTSSWCSICLYPGKNGRCSKIIENSKIGMSRHLDSSTTTQMDKIMVQYGRPSRSSWAKSVRSSFNRTVMGKAIWKILLQYGWEKVSNWECLFVHREKGLFLSVYVDDIKIGWRKTKIWSDVESTQ